MLAAINRGARHARREGLGNRRGLGPLCALPSGGVEAWSPIRELQRCFGGFVPVNPKTKLQLPASCLS